MNTAKEQAFYSMVKIVASNFIQAYLPIPEDEKLEDTLKECWLEYNNDLMGTCCWGECGYIEDGVQKSFVSDSVWEMSKDTELKKELVAFINSIFSFNLLKEINHFVLEFGDSHNYFLEPELVLKSNGVTLDFSVEEEKTIPSIIEHKKYGSVDALKMLHVNVGNSEIDDSSFKESYENCVRYNLECLSGEYSCPKKFEFYLIHLCVNAENPANIKMFTKIKESNTNDRKIHNMTRQAIEDKFNSFMDVMETCIPKWDL